MSSQTLLRVPELNKQGREILKSLKKILRPDQVSYKWPDRLAYGRDCNSKSILWVREGEVRYPPDLIVWPENVQEVSKIAALAYELDVPLVPFGGGSGVCGGTWAINRGITVDLKRMDQVLKIDSRRMQVRAQAGVNGELLERQLQRRGLTLGHFPSSIYSATLGGYLACRSAGQFSTYYGKIEDMVDSIQVVLANGEIVPIESVSLRPRELDLKEIFLGSEGTLGFMTEATLRVHPKPPEQKFIGFEFNNLKKGLGAIREILHAGLKPHLVRLYDPLDTILATSYKDKKGYFEKGEMGRWFHGLQHAFRDIPLKAGLLKAGWLKKASGLLPSNSLLILGFLGAPPLVRHQARMAEDICKNLRGKALGEKPGEYWYQHRYSVSYKLSPLFDAGFFADTMEVATTWNRLWKLYEKVGEAIGNHALVLAHFSHAYPEGCSIYFTFVGYREKPEAAEMLYDQIWREALQACISAGGTISHHHGIGLLKADFMKEEWGHAFEWLQKLKQTLDPKNILNPGKLGFVERDI